MPWVRRRDISGRLGLGVGAYLGWPALGVGAGLGPGFRFGLGLGLGLGLAIGARVSGFGFRGWGRLHLAGLQRMHLRRRELLLLLLRL